MNEQEKIKNQFESYVKKWNVVLDLSKRFNATPAEITSFLFEIGMDALKGMETVFSDKVKVKTKDVLILYREYQEFQKKKIRN